MKRLVWVFAVVVVFAFAAGDAFAQNGGNSGCQDEEAVVPGPNGCNNYGLCKAFFAGSENGRSNKRNAPPFVALVEAACGMCEEGCECDSSNNQDGSSCNDDEEECVAMFCPDTNPGGKGKNPSDGSPGQNK